MSFFWLFGITEWLLYGRCHSRETQALSGELTLNETCIYIFSKSPPLSVYKFHTADLSVSPGPYGKLYPVIRPLLCSIELLIIKRIFCLSLTE